MCVLFFFFFKQKTAYEMRISDWSSDVCSSDLIGSGNLGGGELTYEGKTHSFTIGGLGIGGFGVSTIKAEGEVYNLTSLDDFDGAYGKARTGVVVGDKSAGQLWLQNPSGVYIHLITQREGLALSLGGDAIYISID